MDDCVYDQAEILVCDPVVSHRAATRSALYSMGFRNIESVSTLRDFSGALRKRPPDLALCAFNGDDDVFRIIQELRQDPESLNPFVVVLMTAWTMTGDLANRVSNAGVDGLLLRPFSTAVLQQRIEVCVSNRRKFAITSDYVGPDRRAPQSRASSAMLLDPPNSLKKKADGQSFPEPAAGTFEAELREARAKLNLEKLRCDAAKVCISGKLLSDAAMGDVQHEETLAQITALIAAMEPRSRKTEYADVCKHLPRLRETAARLRNKEEYDASLASFERQAIEVVQIVHPEKTADQLLNEIMATVAIIRARREKAASLAAATPADQSPDASPAIACAG